jgi:hypothetical protein
MAVCETTVHPMGGMFELPWMGLQRVDKRVLWQACIPKLTVRQRKMLALYF